jgi:hypothetical protein
MGKGYVPCRFEQDIFSDNRIVYFNAVKGRDENLSDSERGEYMLSVHSKNILVYNQLEDLVGLDGVGFDEGYGFLAVNLGGRDVISNRIIIVAPDNWNQSIAFFEVPMEIVRRFDESSVKR